MIYNLFSLGVFDSIDEELEDEVIDVTDEQEEEDKKFKKYFIINISVYLDTEYDNSESLSIQCRVLFNFNNKLIQINLIIINEKYKIYFSQELLDNYISKTKTIIFFRNLDDDFESHLTNVLINILKTDYYKDLDTHPFVKIKTQLFMFYQIKDLSIAFGFENMLPYYKKQKGNLSQRRGLSGQFSYTHYYASLEIIFQFNLRDLVGLQSGSLLQMAASCGLEVDTKNLLNDYKANMSKAIIEKPLLFLEYGLNDCLLLEQIYERKLKSTNSLLQDVYQIPDEGLFNKFNFPLTLGTIVYLIWSKFITFVVYKNNKNIALAFVKMGILNPMHKDYVKNRISFAELNQLNSLQELEDLQTTDLEKYNRLLKLLDKGVLKYEIQQLASIKYLVDFSKNTTASRLGLRTGGRTLNERPTEYYLTYGADADIQSAYGGSLQTCQFPIGKPRMFVQTNNTTQFFTLKQFMDRFQNHLTSGNYKIIVSGKLSFDQDLIYSKIVSESTFINRIKNFSYEDPDNAVIPGELVMLRNEIINGTITPEIYEALQKIANNLEIKEFHALEVKAAMFWSEEDRVNSIEELADCIMKDTGSFSADDLGNVSDTRTYKWFSVPIKNFIKPLVDKRAILKKDKNPVSQALQNVYKDTVNTFWGILTSVYFRTNNVVTSDIVTGRIRLFVWMMNKSFNTVLSITDGGPYSLLNVHYLDNEKKRLPGIHYLSDCLRLQSHRSIKVGPLGKGIYDWKALIDTNTSPLEFPNLDQLAKTHIIDFWSNYKIDIPFTIEHKMDNIFLRAAYIMKAHYAFLIFNKETKKYDIKYFKIRGVSNRDINNKTLKVNPIYYLLDTILNDIDQFEFDSIFQESSLLNLNTYRKVLSNPKTPSSIALKGTRPGDMIIYDRTFRLNNTHCFINTEKEYKKRNSRTVRTIKIKKTNSSIKAPIFEKYLSQKGIKKTVDLMNKDNLQAKK